MQLFLILSSLALKLALQLLSKNLISMHGIISSITYAAKLSEMERENTENKSEEY